MEPLSVKLRSRKFLLTIFVVALSALNEALGLGIDGAALASVAATVAAWVLGESALDRERIRADQQVAFQNLNSQAQSAVQGLQLELQSALEQIEALKGLVVIDGDGSD